jgi:hypothetical protein
MLQEFLLCTLEMGAVYKGCLVGREIERDEKRG